METWKKALYITWFAEMVGLIGFSFVLPFMPYFIQELGVSDGKQVALWSGVLATMTPLMLVISAPFWGALADRYGRKPMLLRGLFAGSVILALMGCVQNVQQLFILRIMQGFFTGTIISAIALVASLTPKEKSGYALGLMHTAIYVGASVGPLVGGVVSDLWGYRFSFLASALLLAGAGVMIAYGVREDFTPSPVETPVHAAGRRSFATDYVLLLMMLFVFQLSGTVATPILPLFIQKMQISSRYLASTAGFIIAVSSGASVVSALVVGRISDKAGHARMLFPFVCAAGVLCIVQAAARTTGQLMLVRLAYGFTAGGILPLINALINLNTPREDVGKTFGVAGSMSSLGAGIGPLIGGAVASLFCLEMSFVFGGLLLILCGLLFYAAQRFEYGVFRGLTPKE